MPTGPSAPVVAPTIVRLTYKHTNGASRAADCIVDMSIEAAGLLTRSSAVDVLVSHAAAPWQDHMLDIMSNSITFAGGSFIDLDSLSGSTGSFGPAAGHPTTGSFSSADMTTQVAYLVHKNTTAHRGQKQGRMYVPGVIESAVDGNGHLTSTYLSSLNTALAAYLSAMNSISDSVFALSPAMRVVHVHKPNKDDATTWTWSSSDVSSLTADLRCATQRRRLR